MHDNFLLHWLLNYASSDSVDVCRQCCESGIKYGQRKRTNEILSWVKRKRKHIKREELLAFLLDKPTSDASKHDDFERSVGPQLSGLSLGHMCPTHYQSSSYSSPSMSPRSPRRRLCREDTMCRDDGDNVVNSSGRKRSANSSSLDTDPGFSPIAKRIRL